MKIALITDTHWGVRNDNVAFLDNSKLFLESVFFPFLDRNGIRTVIHLGDVVDRRKYININTAKRLREDFLLKLEERNIAVHFIAGNHDTYFKNTNEVNALRELIVDNYNYFRVYDRVPEEITFDGLPILFVPWICDQNRKQSLETINESRCQIAMGHLELQGFEMYKGSIVSHGDDPSLFNRYDMVMSGHYHHRSSDGHIFYLGSHAEFTWSDYNDEKGFHIFDTETRELTFIQNPYKMFKKIWYDDSNNPDEIISSIDDDLKNSMIKVIVKTKLNPYFFDIFVDKIEKIGVIDLQVVEDHLNLNIEDDKDIINEAEDTVSIFKTYIEQLNSKSINKTRLTNTMLELYNEALTIE
jgi:DNA repair exonuclease SbcCD nuclease subunit